MLAIKKDFPILQRKINGKKLVYLDSALHLAKAKGSSIRPAKFLYHF
jgi:selenocysteine lyase/cysteine desulfurase